MSFRALGVCFCLWLLCAQAQSGLAAEAAGSPNGYAWLSVQGTQIVTSAQSRGGVRPFVPVGIGYARDVCISAQDEAVMEYCKARHLNTVRLAFYLRRFNNAADRPIRVEEHLRDHCDPVIAAAKKSNLYVILDDHEYFHGTIDESKARQNQHAGLWDEAEVQEWIDGWVKVAQRYRDEPMVLGYELLNEPHDLRPEQVRQWYGRCIKAIRQVDQRHIIMVGSTEWSHARSLESTWGAVAQTLDAPYNQVVFIFHDYPKDNDPWTVQRHVTAFRDEQHVPVLCTEFGALPGPGEIASRQFEAGLLALCARENIGWMVWTVTGLEDNHSNAGKPASATKPVESCAYSDLWVPVARIMGSTVPEPE